MRGALTRFAVLTLLAASGALAQTPRAMPDLPAATPADSGDQPALSPADRATLAALQADLAQVSGDLARLRSQILRSGPSGFAQAGGDTALDRLNAMEARVTALTAAVEERRNALEQALEQAQRRMGDIEFRLCELEPECNLGDLTGAPDGSTARIDTAPQAHAGAASEAEQAAFDTARAAFDRGEYAQAAALFAALAHRHAGGALTAQALYLQGVALDRSDRPDAAAEAWLTAYAAEPKGAFAAKSLLGVARALHQRGDTDAACLTLLDIPAHFPDQPEAAEADDLIAAQSCLGAAGGDSPADPPAETDAATDPAATDQDPEGEADLYAPDGH